MNSLQRQRGITLIEACVTLAVLTTVAASAAPGMRSLLDARRLAGSATQLAHDLQFARDTAIARSQRVRFSVHATAAGSCYASACSRALRTRASRGRSVQRRVAAVVRAPALLGHLQRHQRDQPLAASRLQAMQSNVASILFA